MQGSALNFKALERKIQLTQLCEKASFQHLVIARNYLKIRPDETTFGEQYSRSRSYPKAHALAAIPERTTVGPVLEVHIVEMIDGYGIEAAIQSIANPENASYVVITREAAQVQ